VADTLVPLTSDFSELRTAELHAGVQAAACVGGVVGPMSGMLDTFSKLVPWRGRCYLAETRAPRGHCYRLPVVAFARVYYWPAWNSAAAARSANRSHIDSRVSTTAAYLREMAPRLRRATPLEVTARDEIMHGFWHHGWSMRAFMDREVALNTVRRIWSCICCARAFSPLHCTA
jgi:hypothetical protein